MKTDTLPMSKEVLYSEHDGIGVVTINRPQARNALNWAAQEQFSDIVNDISDNLGPRALIITGAGEKAFASGGDLKELAGKDSKKTARRLLATMGLALNTLTQLPIPVIGSVNGDAIGGGCEILTACDLRISKPLVQFRFAQIQVALTTGWGGTARLVRLIHLSRAMELLLTGRPFSTEEAYRIGFIHRVVGAKTVVLDEAIMMAAELIALPSGALAAAKKLAWDSTNMGLNQAYLREREGFIDLWPEKDHLEAMAAFNEKRPPRFGKPG